MCDDFFLLFLQILYNFFFIFIQFYFLCQYLFHINPKLLREKNEGRRSKKNKNVEDGNWFIP